MKYGYICRCGWRVGRAGRTRVEYALAKMLHALGKRFDEKADFDGCKHLEDELKRSGAPGLQP